MGYGCAAMCNICHNNVGVPYDGKASDMWAMGVLLCAIFVIIM